MGLYSVALSKRVGWNLPWYQRPLLAPASVAEVRAATPEQLLTWWRFLPSGHLPPEIALVISDLLFDGEVVLEEEDPWCVPVKP